MLCSSTCFRCTITSHVFGTSFWTTSALVKGPDEKTNGVSLVTSNALDKWFVQRDLDNVYVALRISCGNNAIPTKRS